MFTGNYNTDHMGDMYMMWNPITDKVHVTHDIIWLKQKYFVKLAIPPDVAILPLKLMELTNMRRMKEGRMNPLGAC